MRLAVQPTGSLSPAERFAVAIELAETGVALMRQNLRRRNPAASEQEVDRLLRAWLAARPPDSPGVSRLPAPG